MEEYTLDDRPPNYRKDANILSVLTFWWTFKIFQLGRKRDLYESDLPEPLEEHKSSVLGDKIARLWSTEYFRAKAKQEVPSLTKVLCQCFLANYLCVGLASAFIELILRPAQPLFLGLLVRYFTAENRNNNNTSSSPSYLLRLLHYHDPNQSAIKKEEAIVYACGIVLCSAFCVFIQHPYMVAVMHLGMKIRVACTSLLYRKTLRMSMLSLSPMTVGNVVNLMSNDVTRFDLVTMFLNYLWISPLQMILFIYILYQHVNISALVGVCVIFLFIPIQMWLAHLNKSLRWKTALKTDERVRLMNEIIAGIQVIKMYAWEHAFCRLIYLARLKEMKILVLTSYIRGTIMAMIMFISRSGIFITLTAYVLLDSNITSEKVFVITGYYILMRQSMTVFFPQGVTQFAETLITIKRTRDYLMNDEAIIGDSSVMNPAENDEEDMPLRSLSGTVYEVIEEKFEPRIRVIEAYARWNNSARYVLRNVELCIENEQLVVLIGQVGSGKSSLLHVILKELPVCEGYVSVRGTMSYASQQPWLFAGSVRQNILFGHEYNRERYRQVCKVCALSKDFTLLPYGDQTIVGERGISLSGGQRARVGLARCIYKQADIYVLDDPLSAVDTHVGAQIFKECIQTFLKTKIRVLVTHQLQYLQHVDKLIIMERGRILAKGTYDELLLSGLDFAQYLCAAESSGERHQEAKLTENLRSLSFIAQSVGFFENPGIRHSLLETRGVGKIGCDLYKQYMRAGGNWVCISCVIFMFLLTQWLASASDFFVAQWVKFEEHKVNPNVPNPMFMESLTTEKCILSYTTLTVLLICSSIARSIIFFYVCLRASIRLHDAMFESIVYARMRFFNLNTSGRILNRFSKDMGSVDEDLPYAMIDFTQMFLNLVGVVFVLCITSYFLIPLTILIIIIMIFIRKYYLNTSRSVKRLEGIVRSAVFGHLNASIQGLTTIRSHEAEEILTYEFDRHQDVHSSSWFLFINTSRAFSLWTDLVCALLTTFGTFIFIILEFEPTPTSINCINSASEAKLAVYYKKVQSFGVPCSASDVGLIVTQCITLTGLIPWGMRQSAEMENQMTSVERVVDFINVDKETGIAPPGGKRVSAYWPDKGEITFQNLVLSYGPNDNPVLKNLNFTITSKEKIGIVGRTGAGKSSLISALFRLSYASGGIIIDDINIFEIGLHELRRKISIIPQEPIIFTGTMRYNLDPFRDHSDETLLAALTIVDLEAHSKNVLNIHLSEGGTNFSAGQKQLLCLARAIVRNNRILVLDEATANVDPQTDALIQHTIRTKFEDCTVLTIAHRLHTVMDSDRVLVMHAGQVVEFDHPHVLLQNENGYFTLMVNQTGKTMAEKLADIARTSFMNKQKGLPRTAQSSSESSSEHLLQTYNED